MSETNDQNSENKVGEKLGSSGNNFGEGQGRLEKVGKIPEKVATAPENAVEEKSDKDKDKETEVRDILLDASKKLHSVSRISKNVKIGVFSGKFWKSRKIKCMVEKLLFLLCFYKKKKKSLKLRHSSDLSDFALLQVHESMNIS